MNIIISGNPVDGLTFNGPFDTGEEAAEWAEINCKNVDWWLGSVEPVEADKDAPSKFVGIHSGKDEDESVAVGPFLYESDAVVWSEGGIDRSYVALWTPAQFDADHLPGESHNAS